MRTFAAQGNGLVPAVYLINPYAANNVLGSTAAPLITTSETLYYTPAYAAFSYNNDFTFSYMLPSVAEAIVGGVSFTAGLGRRVSILGAFNLLSVENILSLDMDSSVKIPELTGYQSYTVRPAVSIKINSNFAAAVNADYLYESMGSQMLHEFNFGLSFAGNFQPAPAAEDLRFGLFADNMWGLFTEGASPFCLRFTSGIFFLKRRLGIGLGAAYEPLNRCIKIDTGLTGTLFRVVKLQAGLLSIGPQMTLNFGAGFNYRNIMIMWGIRNVLQNDNNSVAWGGDFENLFSVNILYKPSGQVNQRRLYENMQRITKLLDEVRIFILNKKYPEAIKSCEQILKIDPHHVEAGRFLEQSRQSYLSLMQQLEKTGKKQYCDGNYLNAIQNFKIMLANDPHNRTAQTYLSYCRKAAYNKKKEYYSLASGYLDKKNYDLAVTYAENVLLIDPDDISASRLKEKALDLKLAYENNYKSSLEAAQKLHILAGLEIEQKNYEKGLAILSDIVKKVPGFKPAHDDLERYRGEMNSLIEKLLSEGLESYNYQNLAAARQKWQQVLNLQEGNKKAKSYLTLLSAKIDKDYALYTASGENLTRAGRLVDARRQYRRALEFKPADPLAVDKIARLDLRISEIIRAEKERALALMESKMYSPAREIFISILQRIGDDTEIRSYIERIDIITHAGEKFNEVSLLTENRAFIKARELATNLLTVIPDYPGLKEKAEFVDQEIESRYLEKRLNNLFMEGVSFLKKEKYDEVLDRWREIIVLDPGNTLVKDCIKQIEIKKKLAEDRNFSAGQKAFLAKEWLAARELFKNALEQNPQNQETRNMLMQTEFNITIHQQELWKNAVSDFKNQDYSAALKNTREVLKFIPDSEEAQYMAGQCRAILALEKESAENEKQDKLADAVVLYRKIQRLNPGDLRSMEKITKLSQILTGKRDSILQEADELEKRGEYLRAIERWETVAGMTGEKMNSVIARNISRAKSKLRLALAEAETKARKAEKKGQFTQAIQWYRTAYTLETDPVQLSRLSEKIEEIEKNEQQRKTENKAAQTEKIKQLKAKGMDYYKNEKWIDAIRIWKEASGLDPADESITDYIQRAETKKRLMGD